METLFSDIQHLIARDFTEVEERVDEDYGQLELGEDDQYPILFPCVLISIPEISWRNMSTNKTFPQKGVCSISVRLAMQCYDDTHYRSGTAQKASERMNMAQRLNKLLHGYKAQGSMGEMVRTATKCYTLPLNIKVYEQEYWVEVLDAGDA